MQNNQNEKNVEENIYDAIAGDTKPDYSVLFKAHAELEAISANSLDRVCNGQDNNANGIVTNYKPKTRFKRRNVFVMVASLALIALLGISIPLGIIYGDDLWGRNYPTDQNSPHGTNPPSRPGDGRPGDIFAPDNDGSGRDPDGSGIAGDSDDGNAEYDYSNIDYNG